MADSSLSSTPIPVNHGIGPDPTEDKVDEKLYCSMIGSIMYLTASRPNIMYPTCLCARYKSSPRVSHLTLVKRILQYLKGNPGAGLWYPRDDVFELRAFSNYDYGSCKLNAKFTTAGLSVIW
ncbi:putative mitochondrial protein AtMg00240 [Bidens hawaiensis]|uniref:putative mitochondrial protein AtMg00240 n=1 Tax=Bidens hawaiensis TaxID=980011 RepID=UPI00404B4648